MNKLLLIMALVVVVGTPGLASAQQWFDFNGQTLLPAVVGDPLTSYTVVNNNGVIDTPIPLDFDNFQYTIVITGLIMDIDNGDMGGQTFSGGVITLFEDDATVADFTNAASFVDGTPLLTGTFQIFNRALFTSSNGSGSGTVDWTGGTRLDEFAPADQLNWTFVVGISNRSSVTEPGYDENWDGKVEPIEPVVSGEFMSVGQLKGQHQ
jgi:hypothetical protein